ncbi:MAG: L-2-amino-thiazoline-4-carboxylic acid hydrolase [Bacteroides sp.]|nr:L-2-amino-thiazoline-4-carboxylic acid hydrolase [Eubacterium sp.]MCM1418244.1 L-2-amino-thiazoline-4-carboxylic acid hydrolase [Roseburia sp.]MCM1462374.1 L-2-amino-thiazoline-4-carboxylic acid hydrolase [Bacteroides sp.]
MSDRIEILDGGEKMKLIKKTAAELLGEAETEVIWEIARKNLRDILTRYPNIPPKEKRHTDLIFPHIAVYKALRDDHGEVAMEIMERGEALSAKRAAKKFQTLVGLPLGKRLFLKGFAAGCKSGFGAEAGFKHVIAEANARRYQMDVVACPYVKYCAAEGCGELTHIFCDNDVYAYGHLDGIAFERTQTLGTGGEKCDFLLYLK